MHKIYRQSALTLALALFISACGGGSSTSDTTQESGSGSNSETGSGTDTSTGSPANANSPTTDQQAVLTGRFVDSPVTGLAYTTQTRSGSTAGDGSFEYLAGEQVTFSIGDIQFPGVAGAKVVTPLTVFSTDNIGDTRVINLSRLLQSLDLDDDPDNGITLGSAAATNATGLSVDFSSTNFDGSVANLVANSGSSRTELLDGESALNHLQETLFEEGLAERPQAPPAETNTDNGQTGSENPPAATHPAVGTSVEFSNLAHNVSGTLTVLDNRTLQVTNFVYDGGGPSVYFYTGSNGVYRSSDGGQILGPLLSGRTYNNETITLDIPSNLTLDDFDGISVWCDIFSVNFGDARFR